MRSPSTTARRSWSIRCARAFSAWYELFPRSCARDRQHGRSRLDERLPYVAELGFDVLYLPPIHPIGTTARKGKNNAARREPGDVGSPWAIGAEEGGHKAIHPELGTLEDFRALRVAARSDTKHRDGARHRLPVLARPSLRDEHPEWFRWRPDGTVQYAENPPKKYQDIYPFDFETEAWQSLWDELASVFEYWIGARREDLPRRQSAHQAVRVLGMVHRARSSASIRR